MPYEITQSVTSHPAAVTFPTNFFVILAIPHKICSKMTVGVWLLPCNYTASAWRQCAGASGSWDSRVTESQDIKLHSASTLVIKKSGLESTGLHSVVGDASKGLPTSNQRRWCGACVCIGRTWPAPALNYVTLRQYVQCEGRTVTITSLNTNLSK